MKKDCAVVTFGDSDQTYGRCAHIFDVAEYVIEFEPNEPWETDGWEKTPDTTEYSEWRTILYEKDNNLGAALLNARLREWPDSRVELMITPHTDVSNTMNFTVNDQPADGFIVETDKNWTSLKFSAHHE